MHAQFNLIEGIVWLIFSAGFLWGSRRSFYRSWGIAAALGFLLFGISDLIEMSTGAWYRPWPLGVLKVICVLDLGVCYGGFVRARRAEKRRGVGSDSA